MVSVRLGYYSMCIHNVFLAADERSTTQRVIVTELHADSEILVSSELQLQVGTIFCTVKI
jgi:hypothetical protein